MKTKHTTLLIVSITLLALTWLNPARAAVSITAATGGSNLSATNAANAVSPAWTTLGPITITEGANGDFALGTDVTLVLKTPAGFQFNTAAAPDVTFTSGRGIASASAAMTDASTLTLTLTVTNTTSRDILTIGSVTALQVQPTATAPLASGKHIYRPTTGGGTATINGITADADGSGGSNFGTLTEVAGPFIKLQLLLPGESAAPGTLTGKTGTPDPQTAGLAFSVTINGVDEYWNVVASANGPSYSIQLTSSDPNAVLPGNKDLHNGTIAQSVTLRSVGTATLTAADVDDATKTPSTSPPVTVNAGPFTKLQVLMPGETAAPASTSGKTGTPIGQTVGVPFTVTVNAVDAAWNPIVTNDTVHLTSSDANALLPADAALVAGTISLSVTLKTAGNRTVTASDVTQAGITANTGTSTAINPGPFVQLQVVLPGENEAPGTSTGKTGTPSARTAGNAFNATVNAVDSLWNVVKTNPVIAITSSDPNATLPANAALNNGTKNFSVTFKTAGTQTVTATDVTDPTLAPATSAPATVNAGALAKLQLLVPGETAAPGTTTGKLGTPSNQTSNVAFSVTVNGVDANWNVVNSTDAIRLYSSDPNALLPPSAALVAGTRNFSLTLLTVGTSTLTASNVTHSTIAASTSPGITVQSGTGARPTITRITPQPDGNMQLDCACTANQTYYVQGSPDLSAWTSLYTNTADGTGRLMYWDLNATNYSQRFYRLLAP